MPVTNEQLLSSLETNNTVVIDALGAVEGLHQAIVSEVKTRKRHMRILAATLVVDLLLSFSLVGVGIRLRADEVSSTKSHCHQLNQSRGLRLQAFDSLIDAVEKEYPSDAVGKTALEKLRESLHEDFDKLQPLEKC